MTRAKGAVGGGRWISALHWIAIPLAENAAADPAVVSPQDPACLPGPRVRAARGKRRRLKADRPARRFLEADELTELLAIAVELDCSARSDQRIGRRPMLAVMAKSGLRVGEACAPCWRSVDTAHQRLILEQAKTLAGVRDVDLGSTSLRS